MNHPFADLIGLEVNKMDAGSSVCALEVSEKLMNPHKVAHGAVLYAPADTGMGAAIYPLLAEGELCATVEIKINYFAPARSGLLTCKTKVIFRGKSSANLESEIFAGETLLAKANGSYAIFKPANKAHTK